MSCGCDPCASQGTIDQARYTSDLADIARNNYPYPTLARLPFNWFVPTSGNAGTPAPGPGAGPGITPPLMVAYGPAQFDGAWPTPGHYSFAGVTMAPGDLAILFVGASSASLAAPVPVPPSGWSIVLNAEDSSNADWSSVFSKTLTAADIAAGSVTLPFVWAQVAIVGGGGFIAEVDGSYAFLAVNGSRTITTSSAVPQGSICLYWTDVEALSPGNPSTSINRGTPINSVAGQPSFHFEQIVTPGPVATIYSLTGGFGGDLFSVTLVISQNLNPQVRSISPMQHADSVTSFTATFPGALPGDQAIVFFGGGFAGGTVPPAGWSLLTAGPVWSASVSTKILTSGDIAGGATFTGPAGGFFQFVSIVMRGGAWAIRETDIGFTATGGFVAVPTSAAVQAGDLGFFFASSFPLGADVPNPTASPGTQLENIISFIGSSLTEYSIPTDGALTVDFNQPTTTPGQGLIGVVVILQTLLPSVDGYPTPISSVVTGGPKDLLVAVQEALDLDGNYFASFAPNGIPATGFVRLNQDGPWIPFGLPSPLMPGLATPAANYAGMPIAGGFNAIETAFGTLEWRPSAPAYYSGANPPNTLVGAVLALLCLSKGLGAGIGNGSSSTYAIPTTAGPVQRLKECVL